MAERKSKREVDYSRGMRGSHCGICRYFRRPNACTLVAGHIEQAMWCKLFAKGLAAGGPVRRAEGGYIPGVTETGNIDLHKRPVVRNPDNTISTVRSITIGSDGGHYVIPTVVGDRVVSNDEAVANFRKTGEHLGRFDTLDNAEAYSQSLHEDQAREYGRRRGGGVRPHA